jgi:hypothetical protein
MHHQYTNSDLHYDQLVVSFRADIFFCLFQMFRHLVIYIQVLGRAILATPDQGTSDVYPRPTLRNAGNYHCLGGNVFRV